MAKKASNKHKKTISQLEIAKEISDNLNYPLSQVQNIIEMEQKLTMQYVQNGTAVVKKNYLTLSKVIRKGFTRKCGLNQKTYTIPDSECVKVKIGEGFKSMVNPNKPMKNKICRFVDKDSSQTNINEKSN